MSYDLIAFDPGLVDDAGFDAWWAEQDWDDDAPVPPRIADFTVELQRTFPSMDEPGVADLAEQSGDQDRVLHLAGYSLGKGFVYVTFSWPVAGEARRAFLQAAQQCGVAVALVSDDGGAVLRPVPTSTSGDEDGRGPLVEDLVDLGYRSPTHSAGAVAEVLPNRLGQLNGEDFGIYVLETSPRQRGLFRRSPQPVEYIQSAGSAAAMSVEVKRREAGGAMRQYAVGRPVVATTDAVVRWADGERSLTVPANEVFTAAEALPVYEQWCRDGTVPPGCRLRLLDL